MARFITFSRTFPAYHPKKGQPTYFVEKLWKGLEEIGYSEPPYFFTELSGLSSVISGEDYNHAWPKHHTIRAGNHWKVGDYFSPRVWSGKPYASKMITIAPDIKIEKVWSFEITKKSNGTWIDFGSYCLPQDFEPELSIMPLLAKNDGLTLDDLLAWFEYPKPFTGQIICWNKTIDY